MPSMTARRSVAATILVATVSACSSAQIQEPIAPAEEDILRSYTGVYQWEPNAFVYLQMWEELSGIGKPTIVAFDESGEVRTLYANGRDIFFTGPGAGVATPIESHIEFQRDNAGQIASLTWQREGIPSRIATRVKIEEHEDVYFSNGDIQLAGTLISPTTEGKHPAVILVHGSGPQDRESLLPWARFLIRHGMAVFGYDKRGVGGSTGDWNSASFEDLASDAVAAFDYLKSRPDIDGGQIGLMGLSQAGWIMPLAAVQENELAFLISVSGAGVSVAETTLDQARNEMTMTGTPPQIVERIIGVLQLQYEYARTGRGWGDYAVARERLAAELGPPPSTIPEKPDDPYWQFIRLIYFYDPGPTLRQLQTPTLALFGELDNNIVAEKNKRAWEEALKASGNRDYTLEVLPKANHLQWEANVGSNAEMASLHGYVPVYFSTIQNWLSKRVSGVRPSD